MHLCMYVCIYIYLYYNDHLLLPPLVRGRLDEFRHGLGGRISICISIFISIDLSIYLYLSIYQLHLSI